MKKVASILFTVLAFAGVSLMAGPAPGGWHKQKTLSTVADFAALQPGDQVAQVCKNTDTVSVIEIQSKEQAMKLCEDGAKFDCPSCKNTVNIVRTGPPSKAKQKIQYVDDHGENCMYISKLEPKSSTGYKHGHKQ